MPDTTCTVERKCSSTGKMCFAEDRACKDDAVAKGLEIICERKNSLEAPDSYVYCPPGAEQRDSNIVWILLVVAVVVAAAGGLVAFLVFRKSSSKIRDAR
jgi:hypothetical protein